MRTVLPAARHDRRSRWAPAGCPAPIDADLRGSAKITGFLRREQTDEARGPRRSSYSKWKCGGSDALGSDASAILRRRCARSDVERIKKRPYGLPSPRHQPATDRLSSMRMSTTKAGASSSHPREFAIAGGFLVGVGALWLLLGERPRVWFFSFVSVKPDTNVVGADVIYRARFTGLAIVSTLPSIIVLAIGLALRAPSVWGAAVAFAASAVAFAEVTWTVARLPGVLQPWGFALGPRASSRSRCREASCSSSPRVDVADDRPDDGATRIETPDRRPRARAVARSDRPSLRDRSRVRGFLPGRARDRAPIQRLGRGTAEPEVRPLPRLASNEFAPVDGGECARGVAASRSFERTGGRQRPRGVPDEVHGAQSTLRAERRR